MKRGKPMKRTPMKRKTQIAVTPEAKLKRRMHAMKPHRPKYDPAESPARAAVRGRSGGVCEVQKRGVCEGQATNYQHRVNRSQLGGYSAGSGLAVCGSGSTGCHGYIHQHPAESYRKGWSVRSWDNPLTRPVLYRGKWALLDDEGGVDFPLPLEEAS